MPADKNWQEWSHHVLEELIRLNTTLEAMQREYKKDNEDLAEKIERNFRDLSEQVDKINYLLYGNGTPEKALLVRMDRLEQNEQRRSWLSRATILACISSVIASIVHWIKF